MLERMARRGPPLYARSHEGLIARLMRTFGPQAPAAGFELPPPPTGAALRAVIREYEIDPARGASCHDLEPGADGRMYTERGYWLDPRTLERGVYPVGAGAHSIERAANGDFWITVTGTDELVRLDPATGEMRAWTTPYSGPRRLRVAGDGMVWVPFFGHARIGRFDPYRETWKTWELPTGPPGTELPYALAVEPRTGDVWVTGSNSDTLIRFRPARERFDVFPLPTPVSWTREIEFDARGHLWTCTSNARIGPGREGVARFIELELPVGGVGG